MWVPNIMAQEVALLKDHHATPMEMSTGTGLKDGLIVAYDY